MGLRDVLADGSVFLDLDAGSKPVLLKDLSERAASLLGRSAEEVEGALLARERLGTTALGRGVALPHARLAGDDPPLMLLARLARPIDFEARDEQPVDLVFVVLWPEEAAEGFLPTLSGLCRILREPVVLAGLRRAATPEQAAALLLDGTEADDEEPRTHRA